MFSEFRPLFPHLVPLKGTFIRGLVAAAVYGVATGAGLPLLTKTALPIIFQDAEEMAKVPEWFRGGAHFLLSLIHI